MKKVKKSMEPKVSPYTPEELKQALDLVHALQRIRLELIADGVPIVEYERVFIHGEDPAEVWGIGSKEKKS